MIGPPETTGSRGCVMTRIQRVHGRTGEVHEDSIAVEEPLAIELIYGPADARRLKPVSVTMRTPGDDFELAAGFLMTEGVLRDTNDIAEIAYGDAFNTVRVQLNPDVEVNVVSLERNFYTTSSCGICGKASLLSLRTVSPPVQRNQLSIEADVLYTLPRTLRDAQGVFDRTGGLHAAGLFDAHGILYSIREDVGRHNALDKLLGTEFLSDRTPLRDRVLLLSGRASFELLQKAVMGGVAMVASVGAPSSLAVAIAREFDVTLVGFLKDAHFNVYHGESHISGVLHGGNDGPL